MLLHNSNHVWPLHSLLEISDQIALIACIIKSDMYTHFFWAMSWLWLILALHLGLSKKQLLKNHPEGLAEGLQATGGAPLPNSTYSLLRLSRQRDSQSPVK